MFRTTKLTAAIAVIMMGSALIAAPAKAVLVDYLVSDVNVDAFEETPGNLGLDIQVVELPLPGVFTLNDGDSVLFPIFHISTPESAFNTSDDPDPKPISVEFEFALPEAQTITIDGVTFADLDVINLGFFGSFVLYGEGSIVWNDPVFVSAVDSFGTTVEYRITLTEPSFNEGLFGSTGRTGAKVKAKIKQLASYPGNSTAVPAPAALPAGLALLGVMAARRKRVAG